MNTKRLPAGKMLRLFMAGMSVGDLSFLFNRKPCTIEAALRRQIARVTR